MRPPLTVEELEHWVAFGATWRVVEISARRAIVDMYQCTGELAEQRGSNDPIVLPTVRTDARRFSLSPIAATSVVRTTARTSPDRAVSAWW
jgi:hypothetical protein